MPFVAYVPNRNSDSVSVINVTTNTLIATVDLPAGSLPVGSVVNNRTATTRAYITNAGNNTVSVIDAFLNEVIATIPVGSLPQGIAINSAGTRVYVANGGSNTISVIDTATNTVIATYAGGDLAFPVGVVTNIAGDRLYVTNSLGNTVSVLDITLPMPVFVASIAVGSNPIGIDIAPFPQAGTFFVYVANSQSNNVSVINATTNTVVATTALAPGSNPFGVLARFEVASLSSLTVYITNAGNNTISRLEPNGVVFPLVGSFPVSGAPAGISDRDFGAASAAVYALSSTDLFGIAANVETSTLPIGDNPISLGKFTGFVPAIAATTSDLAVTKTVNDPTASVGSNVIFTITAENLGPDPAVGVTVSDMLPSGFTYVSHSATVGIYDPITGTWAIGDAAVGPIGVLTITATVNATGNYNNVATISMLPPQTDPNPNNNTSSVTVTPPSPVPAKKKHGFVGGYVPQLPGICLRAIDYPQGRPGPFYYNGKLYSFVGNFNGLWCYSPYESSLPPKGWILPF